MKEFNSESHIPLYRQLEDYIVRQIRKGVYKHGEALPSINEFDKNLELGRVTIVQAFRMLVEDGFAISKRGKGYYVNIPTEKKLIGIVAPFHSGHVGIYSNLLAGLRNAELKNDFMSSDENVQLFMHSVDELVNYRGISDMIVVPPIITQYNKKAKEQVKEFLIRRKTEKGINFLILDRTFQESFFTVLQDKAYGLKLLIEKAYKKKTKTILIFTNNIAEIEKQLSELKEYTENVDFILEKPENQVSNVEKIRKHKPDTVFAEDDIDARKILNDLDGNLDFNLAGYNGTPYSFSIRPFITTVNSNLAEVGKIAKDYFIKNKYSENDTVYLEPFIMNGETL